MTALYYSLDQESFERFQKHWRPVNSVETVLQEAIQDIAQLAIDLGRIPDDISELDCPELGSALDAQSESMFSYTLAWVEIQTLAMLLTDQDLVSVYIPETDGNETFAEVAGNMLKGEWKASTYREIQRLWTSINLELEDMQALLDEDQGISMVEHVSHCLMGSMGFVEEEVEED